MDERRCTRRQVGAGVIGGLSVLVAGCLGNGDGNSSHGDGSYSVDIIDRDTDKAVADYHGHWHGDLPSVPVGEHISLGAVAEDDEGNEVTLGDDGLQLAAREVGDGGILSTDSHGNHVHINGDAAGETAVVVALHDGDHVEWESSAPIDVVVE
ncbi:uncharacterized protein NP_4850A [Natronomonas pharaonis DSM 2160]|uniref:Uncharacterized protein n=1 Tax=Natronomonas pharaonis (strain ATCC 35678 / DSM 2160 / CIP 103997 / JCM 8858 / NBRC 14720 / NCIMB 2260 / Gabara) TaxID=348780 RepID=A0A1U7EZ30_NATPD|nr:hypothetical protein [Natronomonas pharaonis]CAI50516.1 uncharacterized protein NP_4850A [Natronomonas pharaonis DSM 2160]